jgi:EAL domain-containing protein (putative c-di-GMP-specific phosphodiesterase class I)
MGHWVGRYGRPAKWYLERNTGVGDTWVIPIEPLPFVIGRDNECSLRLDSKWISRRHAELQASGHTLWVRDLGSTNGTFINRKRIEEAELLEAGDEVKFGKSEFVIRNLESVAIDSGNSTCVLDLSEALVQPLAHYEQTFLQLLHQRAVVPHFQPITRLSDLEVIGYEVLGRTTESKLPSNIGELFDIASQLGHAAELSAMIREAGVNIAAKELEGQWIFVNTHPVEVYAMNELVSSLSSVHEASRSNRIVLEIHEKAAAEEGQMSGLRSSLSELGIALAYDDFGVGHTRLVELAKSPPDFLKFDISLTHQIHLAPKRLHQMVLTFVKAARDLGIATVAEGIECSEEYETCRQLGYDYGQGYLFGRPSQLRG